MKINNYGTQGINPYKKQVNKIDQVKSEAVKGTDKIEISSAAKELQQVTQVSQARTEKIEALKKEIQNGTYQVRAEDVASSIVNFYTKNNQAN
ncbi:flagellar biosynthesis anti-sigma factor FlgM [Niallia taxi]|uniref:Negative regulator of flagellin synthesis n=1 Tax=Niallia taxi TaxID=2499688 RepID=A0A3S2TXR1_9BACI|nr:flagellar biosynthesis anti-sigma factor FlgM [Niallia taxi]MCM3216294.1 flagellar biosynthesis anti-sigma factor FlgM [Niallia taxi]MCT2346738.1 flagellar biosynthesis anti-sigma factor FlgM [Niallia taxi]MDE5054766.1 flagellar biosynthesis anti-sigma factor FlgM [Niallia taxi]MDK8640314.1 flagellar biosynthesis anti-sigma factor FlgM [Niallia taxi]MED3963938.1 flagellar biosynthesis anti-sigma factor FlgM [Niallia taxi]